MNEIVADPPPPRLVDRCVGFVSNGVRNGVAFRKVSPFISKSVSIQSRCCPVAVQCGILRLTHCWATECTSGTGDRAVYSTTGMLQTVECIHRRTCFWNSMSEPGGRVGRTVCM
eukprot:3572985-Rhodomonas_salina.4